MADELLFIYPTAGLTTLYVVAHKAAQIVNATSGALITRNAANWPSAKIALSDAITPNNYVASFPTGAPANLYALTAHLQAGGAAAPGDGLIGEGQLQWSGVAELPDVSAPADPSLCNVFGVTIGKDGQPEAGVEILWRMIDGPGTPGYIFSRGVESGVSDGDGLFESPTFVRGATYEVWRSPTGPKHVLEVGDVGTQAIDELLGMLGGD